MNKIITISREFGSGGREIGKRLADELGFAYYDQEIIKEICKETGMHEGYVEGVAEKAISLISTQFGHTFVGHGCAEILAERNPFSIFVYADMEAKIKRCRAKGPEEEKLTEKELVRKIKDVDKNRKKIHEMIAPTRWGEKENYDLCVNTTNVEIKKVIPGLAMYAMEYFGNE